MNTYNIKINNEKIMVNGYSFQYFISKENKLFQVSVYNRNGNRTSYFVSKEPIIIYKNIETITVEKLK